MLAMAYPFFTSVHQKVLCVRRRQIQLQSSGSIQVPEMVQRILAREGVPGFYRGFLPNALKNLPNKGAPPYGAGAAC